MILVYLKVIVKSEHNLLNKFQNANLLPCKLMGACHLSRVRVVYLIDKVTKNKYCARSHVEAVMLLTTVNC